VHYPVDITAAPVFRRVCLIEFNDERFFAQPSGMLARSRVLRKVSGKKKKERKKKKKKR
jgi:hypothetical protein